MKKHRLIGLLMLTMALGSCSVKEDRSECPCWLTVDVSQIDTNLCRMLNTRCFTDGVEQFSDAIDVIAFRDSVYERVIERGAVTLTYWSGDSGEMLSGDILGFTRDGFEPDSLYAGRTEDNYHHDEPHAVANLHKQFASLALDLHGYVASLGGRLYLETDYNGMSIRDFRPVHGSMRHQLRRAGDNGDDMFIYNTRLVRQGADCRLYLKFFGKNNNSNTSPTWTADLGAMLKEIGYDWSKEDLDDFRLVIDGYSVTIIVEEWDDLFMFEFNYGVDPDPEW